VRAAVGIAMLDEDVFWLEIPMCHWLGPSMEVLQS
jgi:hypothetical protein